MRRPPGDLWWFLSNAFPWSRVKLGQNRGGFVVGCRYEAMRLRVSTGTCILAQLVTVGGFEARGERVEREAAEQVAAHASLDLVEAAHCAFDPGKVEAVGQGA